MVVTQAQQYALSVSLKRLIALENAELAILHSAESGLQEEAVEQILEEEKHAKKMKLTWRIRGKNQELQQNTKECEKGTKMNRRLRRKPRSLTVYRQNYLNFSNDGDDKESISWETIRRSSSLVDCDIRKLAFLEMKFGPLKNDLFRSARLPGEAYRLLIINSARTIQKWWRNCIFKSKQIRERAILYLQCCLRRKIAFNIVHKEKMMKMKLDYALQMFKARKKARIFLVWANFARETRKLNLYRREQSRNVLAEFFALWKTKYEARQARRKRKFIRATAALRNRKLEKVFFAWKNLLLWKHSMEKTYKDFLDAGRPLRYLVEEI